MSAFFLFALWFAGPPRPHLWQGLNHPRYAVREASMKAIERDPTQRWWILRGTVMGAPEARTRCIVMMTRMDAVDRSCPSCDRTGWCLRYRGYNYPNELCVTCGADEVEHDRRGGRRCRTCRGIGFALRVSK